MTFTLLALFRHAGSLCCSRPFILLPLELPSSWARTHCLECSPFLPTSSRSHPKKSWIPLINSLLSHSRLWDITRSKTCPSRISDPTCSSETLSRDRGLSPLPLKLCRKLWLHRWFSISPALSQDTHPGEAQTAWRGSVVCSIWHVQLRSRRQGRGCFLQMIPASSFYATPANASQSCWMTDTCPVIININHIVYYP